MLVSYVTEQSEVDERLLIEVFQSSIYPSWFRNAFRRRSSDIKLETAKKDSRQSELVTAIQLSDVQ